MRDAAGRDILVLNKKGGYKVKTENEKDMEGIEKFLNRHMMKSHPPEYAYQYCVLLYYEYLAGVRDGWDLNANPGLKLGER